MNQISTLYVAVTTSDSSDLPNGRCRAIYVGTSGNLAVQHTDGGNSPVTFKNVGDGVLLPIGATRVLSTGTTAADIVAVY